MIAEAKRAVLDDGADYIIFGCTGMLGCADAVRDGRLRDGLDVPVIDPVPVTVNVAAALVRSQLAHSKRAYPQPPKKNVVGYADIGMVGKPDSRRIASRRSRQCGRRRGRLQEIGDQKCGKPP